MVDKEVMETEELILLVCILVMTVTFLSIEVKTKKIMQEQARINQKLEQFLEKDS
ncbi:MULTISPECIES: hypothetical protein [Paenibacillus]|uniref:hypothetical protein n=1 Tax=Paenibacillus TaxID=44249 RepID=UPI003AADDBB3